MPHFIVDCSQGVLDNISPDNLMRAIGDTATASGLFRSYDSVKVRIQPFSHYSEGGTGTDFIHVIAYLSSLSLNDSGNLSDKVIAAVKEQAPGVPVVTMVCMNSFQRGE
jgi:5-carboxymethyl-2-hydroxymuconate isomerase